MKLNKLVLILSIVLFSVSCEKEEELWKLQPTSGNEKIDVVDIGEDYSNVIYYKIASGTTFKRNLNEWDLAFASGDSENYVLLNGGFTLRVYNTKDTNFASASLPSTDVTWQWDNPCGCKDSTAIGAWFDVTNNITLNHVYIIDWEKGGYQRKKIKLLNVTPEYYIIQVANLDNSEFFYGKVIKNKASNYTYFNLRTSTTVAYEPDSKDWDFVFTRYRHIYYDEVPITPYQVNGVLINTKHVTAKMVYENEMPFDKITIEQASALMLSNRADAIGFDWKYFDFDTEKYIVRNTRNFILKDADGFYYKLKFIDFYGPNGEKGMPKFVMQRL